MDVYEALVSEALILRRFRLARPSRYSQSGKRRERLWNRTLCDQYGWRRLCTRLFGKESRI